MEPTTCSNLLVVAPGYVMYAMEFCRTLCSLTKSGSWIRSYSAQVIGTYPWTGSLITRAVSILGICTARLPCVL